MAFSQHTIFGGALVAVIFVASIAGIAVTGGPGEARKQREDTARLNALSATAQALACYQQAIGDIPEDLSIVEEELSHAISDARQQDGCTMVALQNDPVTDAPFRLQRQDGAVTHICADFATSSDGNPYGVYSYGLAGAVIPALNDARDAPGEHCFEVNLQGKLEP